MSALRPLPMWPHDAPEPVMDLVRQAKAELGLPYQVIPVPAVPGSPGRMLALGSVPPFLCDAGLAADVADYRSVKGALEWVLTAPEGDKRGFMLEDYLQALMPGTIELTDGWVDIEPEEEERKVVFR